jgi:hypothetical protein
VIEWPLLRRLASPAGLALAVACLALPFLSASCSGDAPPDRPEVRQQWQVSYTGTDILVGGEPDVAWADESRPGPPRRLSEAEVVDLIGQPATPLSPQPLAWLALALIAAAMAATALRGARQRATVTAGLALVAAVALYAGTLLARDQAVDAVAEVLRRVASGSAAPSSEPVREWEHHGWVGGRFRFEYGLWTAIGILLAVSLANAAQSIRWPARSPNAVPVDA